MKPPVRPDDLDPFTNGFIDHGDMIEYRVLTRRYNAKSYHFIYHYETLILNKKYTKQIIDKNFSQKNMEKNRKIAKKYFLVIDKYENGLGKRDLKYSKDKAKRGIE